MKTGGKREAVFLLLQGPLSSFYSDIAGFLKERECRVHKINICGSDEADWQHKSALSYRGTLSDWPEYLKKIADELGVTHFILHGDQRPYHKAAIELARQTDRMVYVTELGYFRPDWMVFEPWGTSANSEFPRDPEVIMDLAKDLPDFDGTRLFKDDPLAIVQQEFRWTLFNILYWPKFPNFQTHRSQSPWKVYSGWLLSKLRSRFYSKTDLAKVVAKRPYFVMGLQLDGDFQLRANSVFGNMATAIDYVLASFAKHAREDAQLFLKLHPHEFNRRRLVRNISRLSKLHGLENRVATIENLSIREACEGAQGFVTVNSSAGFEALESGCPVIAVSPTVYSIDGLSFQGSLDDFWKNASRPSTDLLDGLKKVLDAQFQVRGTLYNENGRRNAAEMIARRLAEATDKC